MSLDQIFLTLFQFKIGYNGISFIAGETFKKQPVLCMYYGCINIFSYVSHSNNLKNLCRLHGNTHFITFKNRLFYSHSVPSSNLKLFLSASNKFYAI